MKKGPSTYFHSHLVDGHDVTNKISRQYGYPANHCDIGSNTAITGGTQPTPEEIDEGWVEVEKENTLGSAKNAFP